MKALYTLTAACLAGLFLSACAHSFNPQTSDLSSKDQCITLQRQMMFSNSLTGAAANDSRWNNQVQNQRLNQQFNNLNCYQELEAARANQPQK